MSFLASGTGRETRSAGTSGIAPVPCYDATVLTIGKGHRVAFETPHHTGESATYTGYDHGDHRLTGKRFDILGNIDFIATLVSRSSRVAHEQTSMGPI